MLFSSCGKKKPVPKLANGDEITAINGIPIGKPEKLKKFRESLIVNTLEEMENRPKMILTVKGKDGKTYEKEVETPMIMGPNFAQQSQAPIEIQQAPVAAPKDAPAAVAGSKKKKKKKAEAGDSKTKASAPKKATTEKKATPQKPAAPQLEVTPQK